MLDLKETTTRALDLDNWSESLQVQFPLRAEVPQGRIAASPAKGGSARQRSHDKRRQIGLLVWLGVLTFVVVLIIGYYAFVAEEFLHVTLPEHVEVVDVSGPPHSTTAVVVHGATTQVRNDRFLFRSLK